MDGDAAAKALISAIPAVMYKETAAFVRSHLKATSSSAVVETQDQTSVGGRKTEEEEEEEKGEVDMDVTRSEEDIGEICSICLMQYDEEELVKELK